VLHDYVWRLLSMVVRCHPLLSYMLDAQEYVMYVYIYYVEPHVYHMSVWIISVDIACWSPCVH